MPMGGRYFCTGRDTTQRGLCIGPRTGSQTRATRCRSLLSTRNGEHGGRAMREKANEAGGLVSVRVQDRLHPLFAPNPEAPQGIWNCLALRGGATASASLRMTLFNDGALAMQTHGVSSRKGASPGRWSQFSPP